MRAHRMARVTWNLRGRRGEDHPDGTNRYHRNGTRVGRGTALPALEGPIAEGVLDFQGYRWMTRAIVHEMIQYYCVHLLIPLSWYEVLEDSTLVWCQVNLGRRKIEMTQKYIEM